MHKWISEDGAHSCYQCGTVTDDGTNYAGEIPCRPGGYEHPPYVLFVSEDYGAYIETCAAHPYDDKPDPAQWLRTGTAR